jgi:hypothetical protein
MRAEGILLGIGKKKKLLYFDWAIVLYCPHNAKPYSLAVIEWKKW